MAGLYIHIPLCASKCAYCDFYSVAGSSDGLVKALKNEMTARRNWFPSRGGVPRRGGVVGPSDSLETIYIGGGTPSLLPPASLKELLDHATSLWDCSGVREPSALARAQRPEQAGQPQAGAEKRREITLEANPEDLTDDYLAALAQTDFNRLSIGVQSFDDGLLRLMNRRHTADRAREAVRAAQRIDHTSCPTLASTLSGRGFGSNISIDLIWGIPGMTIEQWERTLDQAVDLGVQHISAYHLTIEPGTLFGRLAAASEGNNSPAAFRPIPEAETERQYELLCRKLADAGFEHYEISNFARPGFRAVHNSAYWDGSPYLGIGPSAHSFDGIRRREWARADLSRYLEHFSTSPSASQPPLLSKEGKYTGEIYGGETLSDRDLFNERIMVGLRRVEGIELTAKSEKLKVKIEKFLTDGLLVENGNRIAIPEDKFLLADYIIADLFE